MNRREFSTGILKTAAMVSFGAGFSTFVRAGGEGGAVVGNFYFGSGRAADNAVVLVRDETGESRLVRADAAGHFRFDDVAPGSYGVFLTRSALGGTLAAEIEVKPGETVRPELTSGHWPHGSFHVNGIHSPEPAYTLYLFSRSSELIVIGRVGDIRKVPFEPEVERVRRPKPSWLPWDTEVDISIEKTLKGTFPGSALTAIAMDYPSRSSGLFQPGNRVLLHLTKTIGGMDKPLGENQFFTIYPSKAERVLPDGRDGEYEAFYKKHLARPSLVENHGFPTVDELIEDVKVPFSQWDASAFLLWERSRGNAKFRLTPKQETQLANFLFAKETVGFADVPLVHLVNSFQYPSFRGFLSCAGLSFDGEPEDWTNPVVNLTPEIFPKGKLNELVRAYRGIGNWWKAFDPLNIAFDAGIEPPNYNGEWNPEKREAFIRQRTILLGAIRREIEKCPVSPVPR